MTKKHLKFERKVVDYLIGNNKKIKGLRILLHNGSYFNNINNEYYKNACKIWKKHNIKYIPNNINCIKNDWIYDNILLVDDDGRVFKPPGYYTEENWPAYAPQYFKDLPVQIPIGDFRGVFRTLIPKLNMPFHEINYNNSEDLFQITGKNETKLEIVNVDFKQIYNFIWINNIK